MSIQIMLTPMRGGQFSKLYVQNGTTDTLEIDTTKTYIIVVSYYQTTGVWKITNGTMSLVRNYANTSDTTSYYQPSLSGTTLTIPHGGTGANYTCYTAIFEQS